MRLKSVVVQSAMVLLAASGARAETLIDAGITYDSGCRELNVYFDRNKQLSYGEGAVNTEVMLRWLREAGMPSVSQVDAETSVPMIEDACRQNADEMIRQVVTPIVVGALDFRNGIDQ